MPPITRGKKGQGPRHLFVTSRRLCAVKRELEDVNVTTVDFINPYSVYLLPVVAPSYMVTSISR